MARKIQVKRGAKANLPTLSQGEFAMTTDSGAESVFIGNGTKNIELARKDEVEANGGAFIATYGTTTSAEIEAAYQAGKALFAKNASGLMLPMLGRMSATDHMFGGSTGASSIQWMCSSNSWNQLSLEMLTASELDSMPIQGSEYPVQSGGVYSAINKAKKPIVTTAGTGAAYTATIDGITELTVGLEITIIPHVVSTSTVVTLDVNGLGAVNIRRCLSNDAGQTFLGEAYTDWLPAGKPIPLMYNGASWIIQNMSKPNPLDLYGTVSIAKGGTGAATASGALANLGAAPAYTYGTEDLTAGTSPLETGKLHFVYE